MKEKLSVPHPPRGSAAEFHGTDSMERFFGCHVSASGGLHNALGVGDRLGVNTIQVHPSPPQRWNSKPYAAGYEEEFLAARETSAVRKIFFHAIYLINLANPDPQQFHLSKLSLVHYLELCERIGGAGVIFHVGTSKYLDGEAPAIERAAEGINWILDQAPGSARLILEVAAGAGSVLGDRLEELREIHDRVEQKARVGYGLDTQHLWASGYDLRTEIESVVTQIEKIMTLERVWSLHLNDSKTALASRKDRHENLGDGLIGWEALQAVVRHPKLAAVPVILETPGLKDEGTAKEEVARLRKMIGIT